MRIIPVATSNEPIDPPRRTRSIRPERVIEQVADGGRAVSARRKSTFRMADLSRAIRAAQKCGAVVEGVDIRANGEISLTLATGEPKGAGAAPTPFEEWEDRL